jgi:hypothetical protein
MFGYVVHDTGCALPRQISKRKTYLQSTTYIFYETAIYGIRDALRRADSTQLPLSQNGMHEWIDGVPNRHYGKETRARRQFIGAVGTILR